MGSLFRAIQFLLGAIGEIRGVERHAESIQGLSPRGVATFVKLGILGRYEFILPESVALGRLRPLRNPVSAWES